MKLSEFNELYSGFRKNVLELKALVKEAEANMEKLQTEFVQEHAPWLQPGAMIRVRKMKQGSYQANNPDNWEIVDARVEMIWPMQGNSYFSLYERDMPTDTGVRLNIRLYYKLKSGKFSTKRKVISALIGESMPEDTVFKG